MSELDRLKEINKELLEAAEESIKRGHHDTCQQLIDYEPKYPCICGYEKLKAAVKKAKAKS